MKNTIKNTPENLPGLPQSERTANLLLDALCCMILSIGVSMLMATLFPFDSGIVAVFFVPAIVTVILVLITRKWWIVPLFIAGGLLLLAAYLLLTRQMNAFYHWLYYFIDWWRFIFPTDPEYSTPIHYAMVHSLSCVPVAAALFFFIRRCCSNLLIGILLIMTFIIIYLFGNQQILPALCVTVAGFIILAPKSSYKKLRKKNGQSISVRQWSLQLSAIPIAVICVLVSGAITPAQTASFKSDAMSSGVTNLWEDFAYGVGISTEKADFDLKTSGFQPNNGSLGGKVNPNNDVQLHVYINGYVSPPLLKGSVMDRYTGRSWEISRNDPPVDFDQDQHGEEIMAAFDGEKPIPEVNEAYNDIPFHFGDVFIHVDRGGTHTLFYPNSLMGIQGLPEDSEICFDMRSNLFLKRPLKEHSAYLITSKKMIDDYTDFDYFFDRMSEIEKLARGNDPDFEPVRERYLQLPGSLPQVIEDTAREVTKDAKSSYQKAKALETYLKTFTYTLSPEDKPDNVDFVAHFLETKEGYCVYFATAMAVMARTIGLPSRYVTGYGLIADPDWQKTSREEWVASQGWSHSDQSQFYIATNATAHAWVEIYLEGLGWTTFDPTAGNEGNFGVGNAFENNASGQQEPSDVSRPGEQSKPENKPIDYTLLVSIILIAVGVSLILLLWSRIDKVYFAARPFRVRRRYKKTAHQLGFYYRDIQAQLLCLGLKRDKGETIGSFAKRVDETLYQGSGAAVHMADIIMQCRYGKANPSENDIMELYQFRMANEAVLKQRLSVIKYVFKRIIINKAVSKPGKQVKKQKKKE